MKSTFLSWTYNGVFEKKQSWTFIIHEWYTFRQSVLCIFYNECMQQIGQISWRNLTRSLRDSEISVDFVQGPSGSRKERISVSPFNSRLFATLTTEEQTFSYVLIFHEASWICLIFKWNVGGHPELLFYSQETFLVYHKCNLIYLLEK